MIRLARLLALTVAAVLLAIGGTVASAPTAKADPWCVVTGRSYTPRLYNDSGSDGSVKVRVVGGAERTIARGSYITACPTDYYVYSFSDTRVDYSNGYWVIGCSWGWHSHGGGNSFGRLRGGSTWISYYRRNGQC